MYIYVIGPKEGPQKIGYSKNPEARLKSLQTGHPKQLHVHCQEEIDEERAPLIERILHSEMNHKRVKGEWFDLTPDDASSQVIFSIITYGEKPIYFLRSKFNR